MSALQQLNMAEEAEENVHEVRRDVHARATMGTTIWHGLGPLDHSTVYRLICRMCMHLDLLPLQLIEAYSTMLECCHLYGYRSLGKYYQEKALS